MGDLFDGLVIWYFWGEDLIFWGIEIGLLLDVVVYFDDECWFLVGVGVVVYLYGVLFGLFD